MYIVKIFLRNEGGLPHSTLTLREEADGVYLALPNGIIPVIATDETGASIIWKERGTGVLFPKTPSAILLKKGEERLYAFTENGESFSMRKWKLLALLSEEKTITEIPAKYANISEEKSDISAPVIEPLRAPDAAPMPAASPVENAPTVSPVPPVDKKEEKLQKLRALFEQGEPFLGFEKLIEGSKWVRIPEEDYLIGMLEDGGETFILFGVPGRLGEAPDDNCDWTYLPSSEENEEWGYYICKSSDLDPWTE